MDISIPCIKYTRTHEHKTKTRNYVISGDNTCERQAQKVILFFNVLGTELMYMKITINNGIIYSYVLSFIEKLGESDIKKNSDILLLFLSVLLIQIVPGKKK